MPSPISKRSQPFHQSKPFGTYIWTLNSRVPSIFHSNVPFDLMKKKNKKTT